LLHNYHTILLLVYCATLLYYLTIHPFVAALCVCSNKIS